jgi:16S rRNA C967 or C1407 C5-methylase (RsmB/RsmF family)
MSKRRKRGNGTPTSAELPEAFRQRVGQLLGAEYEAFEQALEQSPPVSIRLNRDKPVGPAGRPVPWCTTGRYLEDRPVFTLDPHLHAGAYYVQEASSMLMEQALRASDLLDRPVLALDLCAAPGGKSTHIRSLLHPDSLLVANEVDRRRQAALLENLWKWGLPNVVVSGSDPAELVGLPETFDLIVVDAPCSGEGLFRKDHFARRQWSEALVDQCAMVQGRIVEQAWEALRPGGVLIYSTCTWETAENEQRLEEAGSMGCANRSPFRSIPLGASQQHLQRVLPVIVSIRIGCVAKVSSWAWCANPVSSSQKCRALFHRTTTLK